LLPAAFSYFFYFILFSPLQLTSETPGYIKWFAWFTRNGLLLAWLFINNEKNMRKKELFCHIKYCNCKVEDSARQPVEHCAIGPSLWG